MPLIFGFDFNGISINYPTLCRSGINQLFTILKGNAESAVHLNTL
jgi:hypothetical protein